MNLFCSLNEVRFKFRYFGKESLNLIRNCKVRISSKRLCPTVRTIILHNRCSLICKNYFHEFLQFLFLLFNYIFQRYHSETFWLQVYTYRKVKFQRFYKFAVSLFSNLKFLFWGKVPCLTKKMR